MDIHRRQIHDDILDGTLSFEDLSPDQLKSLRSDFDMDYQPSFEFYYDAGVEIERRRRKLVKKIDHNFFG